ncbi:MAG: phosphatidylserine decarboxylase family protein [Acidobacteria bacterium]|nr:MAG: phosphatidylserine decarboxylase family protein [Acidobacteriota bacterium]
MSIAREGWPLVLVPLGLATALFLLRWPWMGGVFLLLGLFIAFFFRDPERPVPADPRLVLSPADGKVIVAGPAPAGNPLGEDATQVSIFMSVFDVHVNRAPMGGRISRVDYNPGAFLPAFQDKASLANEQNSVTIEDGGHRVLFKQIAGLIARRIVFKKKPGDQVAAGERVGMIKFGSRVDVFLPRDVRLRVQKGDRAVAGVTVVGERP